VFGVLDRRFFPPPTETIQRMGQLLANGELVTATAITLRRMAVGFVLAVVPAIAIGLAIGLGLWARPLRQRRPWIVYAIPLGLAVFLIALDLYALFYVILPALG
jgi:NitT/TauT family transport system permease protein